MAPSFKTTLLLSIATILAVVVLLKVKASPLGVSRQGEAAGHPQTGSRPVGGLGGPGDDADLARSGSGTHEPTVGLPGNESLEGVLRRRGRRAAADELAAACVTAPAGCPCRVRSVDAVVELRAPSLATRALGRVGACEAGLELALGAELLALRGQWQQAELAARGALRAGLADARSELILARVRYAAGQFDEALVHARTALDAGHARAAGVLVSQFELRLGDARAAEQTLAQLDERWQGHPDVLFGRALIADAGQEYGAARRGYLRVLGVDPAYADARLRLGLLTLAAGARDEARHNLKRLVELVGPRDARVGQLESALAGAASPPTPGRRVPPAPDPSLFGASRPSADPQ